MIILFNTVISGSILVFGRGTLRFILQPAMLVYRSVVFLGPYHSISISLWNLLAPKKCRVHFSDLKKLGCFPLPQVASHIFCGILGRRTIQWRVSCMLLFACQTTSDHHPKSGKSPWYVPKWPMPRVCYGTPHPPHPMAPPDDFIIQPGEVWSKPNDMEKVDSCCDSKNGLPSALYSMPPSSFCKENHRGSIRQISTIHFFGGADVVF